MAGGLTLAGGTTAQAGVRRHGTTTFVVVTGASGTPGGIGALSLRGHRTVGVDLPGHRGTDAQFAVDYQCPQDPASLSTRPSPMGGVGLDAYEAAAIAVVRTVAEFGPVVLYGGSMGGVTLNRVGNAVPHLIDRIVYDTAFCCVDLPSAEAYFATPEGATTLAGNLAGLVVADPAVIGAVRANYRTADRQALAGLKEALMTDASDAEFHGMLAYLQPDESLTVGRENAQVRATTWGPHPADLHPPHRGPDDPDRVAGPHDPRGGPPHTAQPLRRPHRPGRPRGDSRTVRADRRHPGRAAGVPSLSAAGAGLTASRTLSSRESHVQRSRVAVSCDSRPARDRNSRLPKLRLARRGRSQ
jgi:pimeloyl-ACP methyl ester carboxylesterase